jgi:hypothetical protein
VGRRHQSFRVVVRLGGRAQSSMIPCSHRSWHAIWTTVSIATLPTIPSTSPTRSFIVQKNYSQEFRSAGFRAAGVVSHRRPRLVGTRLRPLAAIRNSVSACWTRYAKSRVSRLCCLRIRRSWRSQESRRSKVCPLFVFQKF